MKSAPTHTVRIWMAGNYDDAVRALREFCEAGACVSIQKTDFIYTGGMETGICATIINYPRFPASGADLLKTAHELANHLRKRLYQDSYTIETPRETLWFSRRATK